ncbi:REX4 [Paramecium bursaria]
MMNQLISKQQQTRLSIMQLHEKKIFKNHKKYNIWIPVEQFDVKHPIEGTFSDYSPIVSIDCEMVECVTEEQDLVKKVARVSIVNYDGHILFDQFYQPLLKVVDLKTKYSGITWEILKNSIPYTEQERKKITIFLSDKIIVGHSLQHDFDAMDLDIESFQIRDTSEYSYFKNGNIKNSLKKLVKKYLNQEIQDGQHDSCIDARSAMFLYRKFRQHIDNEQSQ